MADTLLCSGNVPLKFHHEWTPQTEVYSNTAKAGNKSYEQIFIYGPDPHPHTVDWMHIITGFDPTRYSAWRMTAYATSVADSSMVGLDTNLVFRGIAGTSSSLKFSATIPVDGWVGESAGKWHEVSYTYSANNLIRNLSAETPKLPMEVIASGYTGTLSAAFGQWIEDRRFFNPYPGINDQYDQWNAGNLNSAPAGCYMSGAVELWPYGPDPVDTLIHSATGG